jgi:O-antigen/teichoic acid export membrane protein
MSTAPPLAGTVFRGALLQVALRLVMRLLGLVSISVTARLLTPTDFGVIGSASIVIGLFAVLQQNGIFDWIVRKPVLGPDDLAKAWSVNLAFNALVAAGIAATAGPASAFLNEPALAQVLRVSALMPLLAALASPVPVLFMRELRFGRDFRLRVTQKVIDVACVIAFCLMLRTYWGVIYGHLASRLIFLAYTHIAFPFRPRLVLRGAGALLGFSTWAMTLSFATYLAMVADEIVVRRASSTQVFGLYHISRDLSRVLVSELVAPAAAALLPGLARLQGERARFTGAAVQAVGAAAIIAIGAGLGVSATAAEAIALLLGRQWHAAAPFLTWLAIGVAAQTLAGLHRSILFALGAPHWSAALWFIRAVVLFAAAQLAVGQGGAMAVAIAFAAASVLLTLFDYLVIFSRLGRPTAVLRLAARPVLAGLAMTAVLLALKLPPGLPTAADAAIKVAVGGSVYGAVVGLAWWLAGRPHGPETALLNRLPGRLGRLAAAITRPPRPQPG